MKKVLVLGILIGLFIGSKLFANNEYDQEMYLFKTVCYTENVSQKVHLLSDNKTLSVNSDLVLLDGKETVYGKVVNKSSSTITVELYNEKYNSIQVKCVRKVF